MLVPIARGSREESSEAPTRILVNDDPVSRLDVLLPRRMSPPLLGISYRRTEASWVDGYLKCAKMVSVMSSASK